LTEPPEFAAKRIPSRAAIRWLDLIVLAAALPVFLLAGLPMLGYGVAAVAWLAQRAIQVALQRRAASSEDPRTIVALTAGGMILRAWMVAGAVFGVGVAGSNDDGLAAAVLVISLFTIYFATQLIVRPLGDGRAPR
jgi:hypothetical protein